MSCGNIKLPMFISHCYIHLVYISAIAGDRDRKRSSKGLLANQDDLFFFSILLRAPVLVSLFLGLLTTHY